MKTTEAHSRTYHPATDPVWRVVTEQRVRMLFEHPTHGLRLASLVFVDASADTDTDTDTDTIDADRDRLVINREWVGSATAAEVYERCLSVADAIDPPTSRVTMDRSCGSHRYRGSRAAKIERAHLKLTRGAWFARRSGELGHGELSG